VVKVIDPVDVSKITAPFRDEVVFESQVIAVKLVPPLYVLEIVSPGNLKVIAPFPGLERVNSVFCDHVKPLLTEMDPVPPYWLTEEMIIFPPFKASCKLLVLMLAVLAVYKAVPPKIP
jgi:hypothetical protein